MSIFYKGKKKVTVWYRILYPLIRGFYYKYKVEGAENLPDEPVIIAANHCQLHSPLACEFYMPRERYTWCIGQMMNAKEVPGYAFQDFWSQKPKWTHWFWHIVSYLIIRIAVCLFNNARTIPVYHDARLIKTFRESLDCLTRGEDVVIFPEHDQKYNNVIYDFQDRFIDIARMYHKKTGRELQFVPMYVAPKLKKLCFGKPVKYNSEASHDEERERIKRCLMDSITDIAAALPEHTVIPYRNYSKKLYPKNRPVIYYEQAAEEDGAGAAAAGEN